MKEREGSQLEQPIKTLYSKIAESAAIAAVSGALGIVSKPRILSPADKGVQSYLQDDVDNLLDIHLSQKRSGRLEVQKLPAKFRRGSSLPGSSDGRIATKKYLLTSRVGRFLSSFDRIPKLLLSSWLCNLLVEGRSGCPMLGSRGKAQRRPSPLRPVIA